jgi:hypothetical protein
MKRVYILLALLLITAASFAQGLEFRLRGGVNFQRSVGSDKDFSLYSQVGAMAGIRISTLGLYGEMLYSAHEEANGLGAINYIEPAAIVRYYTYKYLYAEMGLAYYVLTEDVPNGINPNPDKDPGFFFGLGATTRRIEIGLRTSMSPFKVVQGTASFRF